MAIVSEAVANAESDIARLGPEIEACTNSFIELLSNVANLDLVFEESGKMDLNYLALCEWDDSSRMVVIQTIPPAQTAEQRKRTLASTSCLAAMLHKFGHQDVAVALLGENGGRMFRHEGLVGRCRLIEGCSRIPTPESKFDFSSISGHIARGTYPALAN